MEVTIRPLVVGDAAKLARCFERCYGDSYVGDFFYDPAEVESRLAEGRLRSVVAVDPSGDIVGHMALTRRHTGALTADAGNTVVDPRYRNQQLAARLGAALITLTQESGLVGFHHFPTTAHPIMQKLARQGGGVETGVMLAYIPAGTRYRALAGGSADARLAVTVVYQPVAAAPPRRAFLPPRYRALILSLYREAKLDRSAAAPRDAGPDVTSRLESGFEARRGLLRVHVAIAGADLADRLEGVVAQRRPALVHVDLSLIDPGAGGAVEALRRRGFFYAAVLPEYGDGDVLRLQRLADGEGEPVLPDLATDGAREVLDFIGRDRAEALGEARGGA